MKEMELTGVKTMPFGFELQFLLSGVLLRAQTHSSSSLHLHYNRSLRHVCFGKRVSLGSDHTNAPPVRKMYLHIHAIEGRKRKNFA